ncbi:hypothetical protein FRC05_009717 [Tulasnella sp. 425]|nr:hypothetical protein FRC05_009717 [Tulasnella sp. 425]
MDSVMTDSPAAAATAENDADPTLAHDIIERRRRNDLLPIHRLPPELIRIVIVEVYRKRAYRGIFVVRSVCKYWLNIVDSSPELWTLISLEFSDRFLDMILRNSRNRLLSVKFGYCRRHERLASRESFMQRVIPLVGRWKSLEYQPHRSRPNMCKGKMFSFPLPNLESLTIGGSTFGYDRPIHAPRLRFMDVPTLCSAWGSLSDLRTVKVSRNSPSVDQLYDLLPKWPKLEVLRIYQDTMLLQAHDIRNLPSTPLFLPNLRSLLLFYFPVVSYSHLLRLIDAPNLRRFLVFLVFDSTQYDLDPIFEPTGRLLGAYRGAPNNDSPLRLRVITTSNSFTIAVGDLRLTIKADSESQWSSRLQDCQSALSAVLSGFDRRFSENVRGIQFGGIQCSEDLVTLGPILQRQFPNVEELVVTLSSSRGRLEGPKLVLETLRSPLPPEDGGGWLFPGLATLRLRTGVESTCDGILSVVEARGNGTAQAIQRIAIKNGRIGRDTVAKLKMYIKELRLDGTRYIEKRIPRTVCGTESSEETSRMRMV